MYLLFIIVWCYIVCFESVLGGVSKHHIVSLRSYRAPLFASEPSPRQMITASKLSVTQPYQQQQKLAEEEQEEEEEGGGGEEEDNDDGLDRIVNMLTPLRPLQTKMSPKGSSVLESDNDVLWYTVIEIGSDETKKQYIVDVDTGSSDLFIPGVNCQESCNGHSRYDPYGSRTSNKTTDQFQLDFADQSYVKGTIYTDDVMIGGLIAKNQSFGVADVYSKGLAKKDFMPDGLLGLGFDSLSHLNTTPLLDTLFEQKKIQQRVFGVRLDMAEVDGEHGELTLGGYNEQHIVGQITYSPVADTRYWQIELEKLISETTTLATSKQLIVDTGSTLITADKAFVEQFYGTIQGAHQKANSRHWILPCSNIPKLSFVIGGASFAIDPASFTPGRVSKSSNMCYGGLVASSSGSSDDPWIIGGVFLTNVYTIFDADQKRIGFAKLRDRRNINI